MPLVNEMTSPFLYPRGDGELALLLILQSEDALEVLFSSKELLVGKEEDAWPGSGICS